MTSEPYTHTVHASRCAAAGRQGVTLKSQFVQYTYWGASQCARIIEAWDTVDRREMWKLEMIGPQLKGIGSFPVHKTRQCSGIDGRCVCAGEVAQGGRAELATHEPAEATSTGLSGVTC